MEMERWRWRDGDGDGEGITQLTPQQHKTNTNTIQHPPNSPATSTPPLPLPLPLPQVGKFDGILGLAFDELAVCGNPEDGGYISGCVPTPFGRLASTGVIDSAVFSFYLGGMKGGSDLNGYAGELTFGGYDEKHFTGDLTYVPVSKAGYWQISIDSLNVKGSDDITTDTTREVIVDSGTSMLVGPQDEMDKIADKLGAKKMKSTGEYVVGCKKDLPDIEITIGGQLYSIPKEDYVLEDGPICILLMLGMDLSQVGLGWILGDVFMRKYYSVFDMDQERIGFAVATGENATALA